MKKIILSILCATSIFASEYTNPSSKAETIMNASSASFFLSASEKTCLSTKDFVKELTNKTYSDLKTPLTDFFKLCTKLNEGKECLVEKAKEGIPYVLVTADTQDTSFFFFPSSAACESMNSIYKQN